MGADELVVLSDAGALVGVEGSDGSRGSGMGWDVRPEVAGRARRRGRRIRT